MLVSGQAQIKPKSIKYTGNGEFELILKGVVPSEIEELLACDGTFVKFKFNSMLKEGGGYQEQPENGRMFTSRGGVVEDVVSCPPSQEEAAAAGEDNAQFPCETCIHLSSEVDQETQSEKAICTEGEPLGRIDCPKYGPIVTEPDDTEQVENEETQCPCETCIHLIDSGACGEDSEIPQKECEFKDSGLIAAELRGEDCGQYESIPEGDNESEQDNPENAINLDDLPY